MAHLLVPSPVGPFGRRLRHLIGGAALATLALVASGCCNPAKAPGRCTACVYDNCIVPTFATTGLPHPAADVVPVADGEAHEGGAAAVPMAY